MGPTNKRIQFDLGWLNSARVNLPAVKQRVQSLSTKRALKKQWQAAWLLRAVSCIDLTTLAGDDTEVNVRRLCCKAAHPIQTHLLKAMGMQDAHVTTAAVCVYPAMVKDAATWIQNSGLQMPVAAVATGFPSGQYGLKTRLAEITQAVEDGASEIDIVINRRLALAHDWRSLYDELCQMKDACGKAHMKAILAVGELGSMKNVYKASLVAMMAGADFIKTSTGKEAVNATLPVGVVMCRAIRDYRRKTGFKVGFKPAGGIRTAKDALNWLILMKEELGDEWLKPDLFRIGASGLLTDIERQLYHYVTGNYAAGHEFPMA